jgi:glycosyltransferase involved in cell wall biosynthesis
MTSNDDSLSSVVRIAGLSDRVLTNYEYEQIKNILPSNGQSAPEVSFIILSYNNGEFLRQCLESVEAQDFESYEIIIGDDGSVDGSSSIIEEFVTNSERPVIALLGIENEGIISNYNKCLSVSRGRFIAHIASDDVSLPCRLTLQHSALLAYRCSMCVTSLSVIDSDDMLLQQKYMINGVLTGIADGIAKGRVSLPSPTMMYDRLLIEKYGRLPSHLFNEDEVLGVRAFIEAGICSLSQVTVLYRRHGKSITSKGNVISFREALEWQRQNIPLRIENVKEYIRLLMGSNQHAHLTQNLSKVIFNLESALVVAEFLLGRGNAFSGKPAWVFPRGVIEILKLYFFGFIRGLRDLVFLKCKKNKPIIVNLI